MENTENTQKREIYSFSPFGYEGSLVTVETDLRRGIPAVDIVGLADGSVKEARERVRAAFRNSGFEFPAERVLLSLSPADLKKEGAGFDLAMAVSILNEQNNYQGEPVLVLGELELSGNVRPVRAVHAAVRSAVSAGITNVIVPVENVQEALAIPGAKVMGVSSLSEAHSKLINNEQFLEKTHDTINDKKVEFNEELLSEEKNFDLTGHYDTARAIEIAIAGKHNILLEGAPGCGKTMLAQHLIPALTPKLTNEESQSTTRIYSIAGLMRPNDGLRKDSPFRMPHQTASIEGICGGGPNCRPGEISLAHNGTLFLVEAAEFRSACLQMLRVPLESKQITLSRAGRTTSYPANFQLVMATNPCPCGAAGSPGRTCLCSEKSIDLYWKKFSAPLLDRVEIKQHVQKNENDGRKITVSEMKQHIENAIRIQRENPHYNAGLNPQEIAEKCRLNEESQKYFNRVNPEMSERTKANTLKVALTIANMDNRREIALKDLQEAVSLNSPIPIMEMEAQKNVKLHEPASVKQTSSESEPVPVEPTSVEAEPVKLNTVTIDSTGNKQNQDIPQEETKSPEQTAEEIKNEPKILVINGKPREVKGSFEEAFTNAVKLVDKLIDTNESLVKENDKLRQKLQQYQKKNNEITL